MPRSVLCLVLVALLAPLAAAQQPEQHAAEQRLRELQAQISQMEQQLTTVRDDEQGAVEALTTIDREIAIREALIESYATRLAELNSERIAIENEMERGQRELNRLRDEYAEYARHAYVRGRVGDLALILSASSINEMILRARYLERFSNQRQRAAQQIVEARDAMAQRRLEMDSTAARIQGLLAESRIEQSQLATRQQERSQLVAQARQRRTTLQSEVRRREQEAQNLQQRITDLIAEAEAERRAAAAAELRREEEARAAAAAAAAAAARPGAAPAPAPAAPAAPAPAPAVSEAEFRRLSGSFRQNRGNLPWPVSGVVIERFGPRTNPITNTVTSTPGIVISTSPTTPVRAVFGGAVARVFFMAGWGTCVIVSHGDYQTVYGNLSSVDVRPGQRIEPGATVGRAGGPDDPLGPAVFFSVYGPTGVTDPSEWLGRR
jgi:murein hydrolase activator